jgi:hypothetical protein
MARSRVIHPRILEGPHVDALGIAGAYFWLGLILNADDDGRLRDNPITLRSCINPYGKREVTARSIQMWITWMQDHGMITRYIGADGGKYMQISNWSKYQKVSHKTASKIPPPISGNSPDKLRKVSGQIPDQEERRGEERRERDTSTEVNNLDVPTRTRLSQLPVAGDRKPEPPEPVPTNGATATTRGRDIPWNDRGEIIAPGLRRHPDFPWIAETLYGHVAKPAGRLREAYIAEFDRVPEEPPPGWVNTTGAWQRRAVPEPRGGAA